MEVTFTDIEKGAINFHTSSDDVRSDPKDDVIKNVKEK